MTPEQEAQAVKMLADPEFFYCKRFACRMRKTACVQRQEAYEYALHPYPKFIQCQNCPQGLQNREEVMGKRVPVTCPKCGQPAKTRQGEWTLRRDKLCFRCVSRQQLKGGVRRIEKKAPKPQDTATSDSVLDQAKNAARKQADAAKTTPVEKPPAPVRPAYQPLHEVLMQALSQAQDGKGRERHVGADEIPFPDQTICHLGRTVGLGFPLGQAMKKLAEARKLEKLRGPEAAIREILGAINYAAAGVILYQEQTNREQA